MKTVIDTVGWIRVSVGELYASMIFWWHVFMVWIDPSSHTIRNVWYALTQEGINQEGWSPEDRQLQRILYWFGKEQNDSVVIPVEALQYYYGHNLRIVGSDGIAINIELDDQGKITEYGSEHGLANMWGKVRLGVNPFTQPRRRRRQRGSPSPASKVRKQISEGKFEEIGQMLGRVITKMTKRE